MDAKTCVLILLVISVGMAASPYLIIVDSTAMEYNLGNTDTTYMNETKAGLNSFVDSSESDIGIFYTDDCDTWGDPSSGGVKLIQSFTTDKTALHAAIGGMVETDKKPSLGSALAEAKSYLESTGQKANVVVIGYDIGSCGGIDSEDVAKQIYNNGNGVGTVTVIGFMSSGGSGEIGAQAIAKAGGGKYYHVDTEGDVARALSGIPQLSATSGSSTTGGSSPSGTSGESGSQGQGGICPSGFILLPLAALAFLRQRSG